MIRKEHMVIGNQYEKCNTHKKSKKLCVRTIH